MKEIQRRLLPSTSALAAFEAVARLNSFSAAATALSLTPGAISKHVAALEAQLGTALVSRSNKGIVLTDTGRTYAAGVADILDQIRLLSLEAMSSTENNALHLAILPTFGTRWLLPRIPDFVALHPDITLNFTTRIGNIDFDRDRLDAAIHVGQPNLPGMLSEPLMREIVAPVCSPDFYSKNNIRTPEDIIRFPLLDLVSRPNDWANWFKSTGVDGTKLDTIRFEQFMNVAQASIAGLGIALVPLFMVQPELETGRLIEVMAPRIESGNVYSLIYPVRKAKLSSIQRFSKWLKQQAEDFEAKEMNPGRSLSTIR